MHRGPADADPDESIQTIDRVVDLLTNWPELNEFKHTLDPPLTISTIRCGR
jgi:hypothetical protein